MMDELKDIYMNIAIPEELDTVLERTLSKGPSKARHRSVAFRIFTPLAAVCAVFILMLNTMPVFAGALYEVPVVGDLCRVLTLRSYSHEDKFSHVDVNIPVIDVWGEPAWAARVNTLIADTIDALVLEAEGRAQDYYDAFVATGGNPEDFIPVKIDVDYQVSYASPEVLSFMLSKGESLAAAYNSFHYFNYDIATGKALTPEYILGANWEEDACRQIEAQLEALTDSQKAMLDSDIDIPAVLREKSQFYINNEGRVVIVFEKYALGAGALGRPEFPLSAATM